MKKLSTIIILIFCAFCTYGQNDSTKKQDSVFRLTEQMPTPVDGIDSFYKWFSQNIEYPKLARKKKIQGKILVGFLVDIDGKMKDFKITKGIGGGCDEEVIRILSLENAPKWIPAKQKGKLVKCKMAMPFTFKLN